MKRLVVLFLSSLMVFTLTSCGNENSNNANKNELYLKAIAILDELGEDHRVQDFRTAYELLMSLPNEEDKFISQLEDVEDIFSKYDVELDSGDYYLTPNITVTEENIDEYKSKGAFYDANDLLDCIVYPVLFEKYGSDAKCIKGLTAKTVTDAIKSTNEYSFDDKTEQYDGFQERWEYIGVPKSRYVVNYHSNGLVESLTIPVVRIDDPLNDDEYEAFLDNEATTQKKILSDRIVNMSNQFSIIFTGYEVLSQIFSDEEITVISNYIHSLTLEDIWKRDITSTLIEPENYFSALVAFNYKGYQICISYTLNDISLQISGSNDVNSLTHRWYTLWCGLCLPESSEQTIEKYSDYINNNTAANEIIYDYSFDLDANVDKFKETTPAIPSRSEMLIDTEYYTLSVPNSWNDDCFYEVADEESYNYTLSFYDKASHDAINGGWLFSVNLLTEFEDYSNYPDYDVLGSLEVYRIGSYNIVVTYPTDVQCSEETAAKYREMCGEIADILKTISFKDECTFSEEPIPVEKEVPSTEVSERYLGRWEDLYIGKGMKVDDYDWNVEFRSDGTGTFEFVYGENDVEYLDFTFSTFLPRDNGLMEGVSIHNDSGEELKLYITCTWNNQLQTGVMTLQDWENPDFYWTFKMVRQ